MVTPLRCERCHGTAHVDGVRCSACAGGGAAVLWGSSALTWSLAIDRHATRGRLLTRAIRALTALALLAAAAFGIVASYTFAGMPPLTVWIAELLLAVPVASFFWAGALAFLAAASMFVRTQARDRPAPPFRSREDVPAPFAIPDSWDTIRRLRRIDVSRSLDADCRSVVERAGALAERHHHVAVQPIHCLAAMLASPIGMSAIGRLGIPPDALKERVQHALSREPTFEQSPTVAQETFSVFFRAYAIASGHRGRALRTLDLLVALSESGGVVRTIFDDLGIPHASVVNVATWMRVREGLRDRYRRYRSAAALRPKHGMNRAMTAIATPILDAFAEDLTQLAAAGYIGPIVGRDREFRELLRLLESGRRGAALVGNPGVGRSAMLDGLAERMAADDVPDILKDKRLLRLSVSRLTSGAGPAVAQERLLAALTEAAQSRNIVLAVEQIEHLVGAGVGGSAGIDLGDVLAAELDRAGLTLIGITTPEMYRAHIERSPLGTLLERMAIGEPTGDDAVQIVAARSILIEAKHRVFFSYAALAACVAMSSRYLQDRSLPEKAVALMEEVATLIRKSRGEHAIAQADDVAAVIAEKTGIPAGTVREDEASRLLRLEDALHERIVGQDEAVRLVAAALRRSRTELRDTDRPVATLLFLGPTGVGKTELAKTVASVYYGSESSMVRLDMSEYQDSASIHRLIGAPPGYAGADAGGQLTEAIRRNPFSLVLLDELEKAHPDILNVFLQVFEDGRLTDAAGRTVNFANAMVIATSNAGTPYIQDAVTRGESQEQIRRVLLERELRGVFRPEFLNRFDGVLVFAPLTEEDIAAIARLMLAEVGRQLEEKGIHLRVTDTAVAELTAAGFDPQFGARPLRRAIQDRVQDALATFLLTHALDRRDTAVLDVGGIIRIEKAEEL